LKIFLYTDLSIGSEQLFWHRDLGLLTKAFRSLGHDAWLVVHPATEPNATRAVPNNLDLPREQPCVAQQGLPRPSAAGPTSHLPTSAASNIKHQKSKIPKDPVIWASPSEVRDPFWWQHHQPDLVILGLWTRPKYDSIRRAALSATPRVIERADSDGMRTASCGLRTYARRRYDYFRDRTYRWPAFFSIPGSALYSLASVLATPWIEARLARTLKLLPSLTVETPQAHERWQKLALKIGADPKRIHCIPHPIQIDIFKLDPAIRKKNQIISVGRWESYQKNLPLLLKTLRTFLDQNPGWSSLVIGSGLPQVPPHPRIIFSAPMTAPQLALCMQDSKIFVSSSRYESFGLSMAEALCCGCIPQGPHDLESLRYFRSLMDNPQTDMEFFLFSGRAMPDLSTLGWDQVSQVSGLFNPAGIARQIYLLAQALDGSAPRDSAPME
jgi:glycosyltransferase involved in cell wall biosynthesis